MSDPKRVSVYKKLTLLQQEQNKLKMLEDENMSKKEFINSLINSLKSSGNSPELENIYSNTTLADLVELAKYGIRFTNILKKE
jgi:hypothetical protein